MKKKRPSKIAQQPEPPVLLLEAEIAQGLEQLVWDELQEQFGDTVRLEQMGQAAIRFWYRGELRRFWTPLAQSVYHVQTFDVPRPKALLGDQHFRALTTQIDRVRQLSPKDYQSFYVNAAGSESSIMQRLRQMLAASTGLVDRPDQGDLLIRIRRSPEQESSWETLVRISPRPFATRHWRVCNFEGALNATIARAMVILTSPTPDDCFVNIACGSGTLLIERLGWGEAKQVIGIDSSLAALDCAAANIAAARNASQIQLLRADARELPLSAACADALCADLPFGQLVGSHHANRALYPRLLAEAARVARSGAYFVILTHEVRLLESLLDTSAVWQTEQVIRVTQRGLHPRVYVLRRRS